MEPMKPMEPMKAMSPPASNWWPEGLSDPGSSGAQNGLRYAFFPKQRRLAIEHSGRVMLYDTGDHRISGVSQQQPSDAGLPRFTSQDGDVDLASLKRIG